jgi:hypothetical protein
MSESTPEPRPRLPWARLLVVTCATLVLLPCLCLAGSIAYLKFQEDGASARWRSLRAPPGRGLELVTGDRDVVYVRADAGNLYGCWHQRAVTIDRCWVEVQEPLDIDPDAVFDTPLYKDDIQLPPGTVVDTLGVTVWRRDSAYETRYVLLQDGAVWRWQYSQVGYFDLIIVALALIAGSALAVALVVILWLSVGLRSVWQRIRRRSPDTDG